MKRLASGLALALLALTAPAATAKPAAAGPKPPLSTTGRWITDRQGRVVILHGLNMVNKRPPYLPSALGFGADDAVFLRRNGFNTIRLGLIYKGVEPDPGRFDTAYIRRSRTTARLLEKEGVFPLLDFHQDLYNEKFGGEGWPDWAVLDDGLPAEPLVGFPLSYVSSPGLNRAFDNFWGNARGPGNTAIQRRFAAAWARVAAAFGRQTALLGYDILNEPWPGSGFAACANVAGCPTFDHSSMEPFYRRVIPRLRSTDPRHIVFYEPHVGFDFDADTNIRDLGFRNLGFSFHDYCVLTVSSQISGTPATCPELEDAVLANADEHASRTGDSLLLSEWGATDEIATLRRVAGLADRHMVSWQEWHYCGCDDPTTQGPGNVQALVKDPAKPPRGRNVFHDKLLALARPYPQAIAGTPRRWSFDPASRRFELVYDRRRAGGKGRFRHGITDVFLPRVQYRHGARIEVRGAAYSRDGQHLLLVASPHAKRVRVEVTPRRG